MAITDLTGTKWEIKNIYIRTPWEDIIYNINFKSNSENFTKFNLCGDYDVDNWAIFYGKTQVAWYDPYNDYEFGWLNEAYRTISITGGTDATNATLISWLQANATQIVEPTETNTFSIGNLPIVNMYVGTRQIKKVYLGNALVWEKEAEIPENALLAQDGTLLTSDGGYLITTEGV